MKNKKNGWKKSCYMNFKSVPGELASEEFWLEAVRKIGSVLEFVPEAWKSEALCLAAVQQDGGALQYVPPALKTEAKGFGQRHTVFCAVHELLLSNVL